MNVLSSWVVRVQGKGPTGEEAVMQTTVQGASATVAMALVIDRTRKLDWSDVHRIEITKQGR